MTGGFSGGDSRVQSEGYASPEPDRRRRFPAPGTGSRGPETGLAGSQAGTCGPKRGADRSGTGRTPSPRRRFAGPETDSRPGNGDSRVLERRPGASRRKDGGLRAETRGLHAETRGLPAETCGTSPVRTELPSPDGDPRGPVSDSRARNGRSRLLERDSQGPSGDPAGPATGSRGLPSGDSRDPSEGRPVRNRRLPSPRWDSQVSNQILAGLGGALAGPEGDPRGSGAEAHRSEAGPRGFSTEARRFRRSLAGPKARPRGFSNGGSPVQAKPRRTQGASSRALKRKLAGSGEASQDPRRILAGSQTEPRRSHGGSSRGFSSGTSQVPRRRPSQVLKQSLAGPKADLRGFSRGGSRVGAGEVRPASGTGPGGDERGALRHERPPRVLPGRGSASTAGVPGTSPPGVGVLHIPVCFIAEVSGPLWTVAR